ncbi:hypothetical protein GCM10007425_12800 [Lysinibacillus alkalisoli]|uniref:Phage tail protein n=1 Tax=Lysinibacillus alkalisoli TaxID=1911548 RepID=A0A917G2Q8_9BACI|nr:phage tail protein [Lysinibacillus alkalisoli]GGG19834.1 hypothetical protein GCM10007425_12800 [Lysinibacillus alkalisoli]
MVIGVFGPIIFEVSDNLIRTFDEFTRTNNERWETHDIDGAKPKSEYVGPGLDKISFTIDFTLSLDVNPIEEMDRVVRMSRNGEVHSLVIGNKRFGMNKFKLISVSGAYEQFDKNGVLWSSSTQVELEEYV